MKKTSKYDKLYQDLWNSPYWRGTVRIPKEEMRVVLTCKTNLKLRSISAVLVKAVKLLNDSMRGPDES